MVDSYSPAANGPQHEFNIRIKEIIGEPAEVLYSKMKRIHRHTVYNTTYIHTYIHVIVHTSIYGPFEDMVV